MNLRDLVRLNELWTPVYPYLARHVAELLATEPAEVLEIGPFSGGLTLALSSLWPRANFTIAAEPPELQALKTQEIGGRQIFQHPGVTMVATPLCPLELPSGLYDLVLFRGAFFFLTAAMLQEIFRVLKAGGIGFIGGGYGRHTPPEVIAPLAEESRSLNYRLGKKWVSREEVDDLIAAAGLESSCRVSTDGGLWIILRRSG